MTRLTRWLSTNSVLVIAVLLAGVSVWLVPPDAGYLHYVEWRTMSMLFGVLATITALQRVNFFQAVAGAVVGKFRTLRALVVALVLATALASALFTNDMALVALLPLAIVVLRSVQHERLLALTFVLMALAANLGGMITPFGSPQNLFVYTHYEVALAEFLGVMWLPFAISIAGILVLCLLVPQTPIVQAGAEFEQAGAELEQMGGIADRPTVQAGATATARTADHIITAPKRTVLYLVLFAYTLLIVFRLLPAWAGLLVPLVLLIVDRGALRQLNWGLLGTFAAFFVFAGNLARVPEVEALLTSVVRGNELLAAALASQVISNVPTAIIFAPFTQDWAGLLLGVNIGGVGTLVASLASLIALAELRSTAPEQTSTFMKWFTWLNLLFLVVLLLVLLLLG